uniref:ComF family protein n=1 Tax=Caldicellulosiruptor owensensis TaxID=55205 RepID=A0A7C5ZD78_9FIRM
MEKLIEFFFPPRCAFCGRLGKSPCEECSKNIKFISGNTCQKCGIPIGDAALLFCPSCLRENFAFERVFPVFYYEGMVRRGVHLFKYRGFYQNAITFSKLMAEKIFKANINADIVTFVPTSYERYLQRGFNHSWLLAHNIGRILKVPVIDLLTRESSTKPFYNLSRQERKKEISGKIKFKKGYENIIKDKRVILVDDIFTTGATANECSTVLLENGAKCVFVSVLAITKLTR